MAIGVEERPCFCVNTNNLDPIDQFFEYLQARPELRGNLQNGLTSVLVLRKRAVSNNEQICDR